MSLCTRSFSKITACFLAFVLCVPWDAAAYQVSAKAAIFSNSTQVIRYYGKNVHSRVQAASTVKVMTALLVLEHLPLDQVVTTSERATLPQPSKLHAHAGEKFKVRDLLYALMLRSANDVSVILAEAVAGNEAKFVRMMNRKARQLGARHTHFVNSNGLPSKKRQYTTPYDMYLIFRAALKYDFFDTLIKTRYKTIHSLQGRRYVLRNHNRILFMDWKRKLYGKTGYTRKAGACFVGYLMKGNSVCIIAVFHCARRWKDIKYIVEKYGGLDL